MRPRHCKHLTAVGCRSVSLSDVDTTGNFVVLIFGLALALLVGLSLGLLGGGGSILTVPILTYVLATRIAAETGSPAHSG